LLPKRLGGGGAIRFFKEKGGPIKEENGVGGLKKKKFKLYCGKVGK